MINQRLNKYRLRDSYFNKMFLIKCTCENQPQTFDFCPLFAVVVNKRLDEIELSFLLYLRATINGKPSDRGNMAWTNSDLGYQGVPRGNKF